MSLVRTCRLCKKTKPLVEFVKNRNRKAGYDSKCKECHSQYTRDKTARDEEKFLRSVEERARRIQSDHELLRPEDFDDYDVSVGNVSRDPKKASQAAKEKRQEFNEEMGAHATNLINAAQTAPERGGDLLSAMNGRSGSYIGKLAEQERRFQNRRLARTVSLAQASEALNLQQMKLIAQEFFRDKITPVGYACKTPPKDQKRSVCLLLSDLHIGADLNPLEEPLPYRALEEARRLEYVMRECIEYKVRYRNNTKLVLLINGDIIEGLLGHQLGSGIPLAEQKAAIWSYLRAMIAQFAMAFPSVEVHWQCGNHGRDKVRHPGRATWRKWDGHEFEIGWALKEMCAGLNNVTWHQPFRAVSIINLHGATFGLTHADTEPSLGHPDKASEANARELDKINSTRIYDAVFDAWGFGHYHTGRVQAGNVITIWNGALVPPNGHARSEGWIADRCCQLMWEAVEGFPVGDVRIIQLNQSVDRDESLGKIIKPFRFPRQ